MIKLLIFSSFVLNANAWASFCDSYQPPKNYTAVKSQIDEQIKVFAGKKSIAQKADDTLSKLISAKSPVITGWLNKRNLNSKSEDEIVREWRVYFARNFILTKYPHGDASIDKEIEALIESINHLFANKDFSKKMQTLFSRSKESSLKVIKSLPIAEEQKKKISARIEGIQLYWMKDFKDSKFKQLPMDFLDWGIAYDPVANEVNVGVNALSYPNDETYLAVFSHEIGHSFDSCRWGAFFDGAWPFQKIGDCLRSKESVNAKKRDDSKLDMLEKQNKDLATSLKQNPTCNKMAYPPIGLQSDQLPESFADWFSAEVMSTMKDINPLALRTDLCEKKELNIGSSYPSNELRMNAIYFVHPELKKARKDLKSETYRYCGWDEAKNK